MGAQSARGVVRGRELRFCGSGALPECNRRPDGTVPRCLPGKPGSGCVLVGSTPAHLPAPEFQPRPLLPTWSRDPLATAHFWVPSVLGHLLWLVSWEGGRGPLRAPRGPGPPHPADWPPRAQDLPRLSTGSCHWGGTLQSPHIPQGPEPRPPARAALWRRGGQQRQSVPRAPCSMGKDI